MAPSQLSQLKSALTSAGLNRTSQPKRKGDGKKGGSQERDRQKKLQKLEEIRKGLNKFDERETKVKHDVGGRNLKGVTGRPSQSKQAGLEQRRKTLLPEHKLKGHSGTFHDRRFGESDPNMTPEDRMLERYTRERELQRLGNISGSKKSLFNLEDDEAFGDADGGNLGWSLTHGGRDVGDLEGDDFERMGMAAGLEGDDEEKWKGAIDERTVRRSHFGGFGDEDKEDEPERKKSKAEVMSEIIAKSKEYKHERQQQKEVDEDIRNEIDSGLDDLRALLNVAPPNDIGSSANRMPLGKPAKAGPVDPAKAPVANAAADDMDYDQFVKSLAFDARAKPKDRTKTEDELAIEEKEKLEAAEASRLRRMRGEEDEDEDEGGKGRKRARKDAGDDKRIPDADDLDDDWADDGEDEGLELGKGLLGKGLEVDDMAVDSDEEDGESGDEEDASGSEDEDEEDEDDEMDDDEEEQDDMEDLDEDDVGDLSDEERLVPSVKPSKVKSAKSKAAAKEIPYTFICPATHEDLQEILDGLEPSALPIVVQRIRALYHPSLAQGNKDKLQNLLGVLLDHVLVLASGPAPAFQPINTLLPHIIALVNLNPISAAHHFIGKLVLMQKNLAKGLARGAELAQAKTFPRAPELALLRLVGVIWSTSDFSHPVVAPAVLLMGQYLSQAKVRSVADIASGVFLCSLLSQYESLSKRLIPEALNFLAVSLLYLNPLAGLTGFGTFPLPADIADELPEIRVPFKSSASPAEACSLPELLVGEATEQAKVDLLATSLRLVLVYAQAYSDMDAFIEIFTPLQEVVASLRIKKTTSTLQTLHTNTSESLVRMLGFASQSRTPLRMQAHKPIPIATYMPKFVENYSVSKRYDPDAERNATNKLKAMYKKERKGAIRELRKDNRFLAGEKAREQAATDAAYNAKMRRIEGDITSERAEEKQMQREKGREKRRAGRK